MPIVDIKNDTNITNINVGDKLIIPINNETE